MLSIYHNSLKKHNQLRPMKCPYCAQENVVKNGSNSARKQKYKCNECNKQFVLNPQKQPETEKKKISRKTSS